MTVAAVAALAHSYYHKRGLKSIADSKAKIAWEQENVIKLTVKINRNQDPELFELFTREKGSRGALTKELLRKAIKKDQ